MKFRGAGTLACRGAKYKILGRLKACATILASLAMAPGCAYYPESYPPPMQRQPITDETAFGYRSFIEMNDTTAEKFFVQDVRALEADAWRWTGPNPTLRYVLPNVEGLKFSMDYAIPDITIKETGPVTLSVTINGRVLDRWRCEKSGHYRFEQAVDAGWLNQDEDNIVGIKIDPAWTAPDGSVQLGFILARAGFVE